MKREALNQLIAWKNKPHRKPLIIEGARQVGKTWLMREFGHLAFEETLYINFESNQQMRQLFALGLDVNRLLQGMAIVHGKPIDAGKTLIIFDEIQELPQALTSLKYFHEDAPEYYIVCAGSLLGVALHQGTSFPVGKVEFMQLGPLSFSEFLEALGQTMLLELLQKGDFEMVGNLRQTYIEHLRQYYYVGGMPEVVAAFCESRDFTSVKEIQSNILRAYEQDFSKHVPAQLVPRLRMLWNSVPMQLAKENKKFVYKEIREGARSKDYEAAMLWLIDCGLIHRVYRVSVPANPLKAQEDARAFKLYLLDVGLLACLSGVEAQSLINGEKIFSQYKGAMSEQFVLQQLKCMHGLDHVSYYANESNRAEVDFLVSIAGELVPIEVKAELNLKAKSLKVYREKFQPKLSIRSSMANYLAQDESSHLDLEQEPRVLLNLPLYAVGELTREAHRYLFKGVLQN